MNASGTLYMRCIDIGSNLDILNCSSSVDVVWSGLDSFRNSVGLTQGRSYSNRQFVSSYVARTQSSHDTNFWPVYLPAPCLSEEDLKCYLCYSNKSWDECEKDKKIGVCYPKHGEVCVKIHLVENDDTEKGHKEAFVKMCGQAQLCTDKGCQKKSKTCQVDCCHSDLCNVATGQTHVTSTLLATVLVVLLCVLQLGCIFWTFLLSQSGLILYIEETVHQWIRVESHLYRSVMWVRCNSVIDLN